MSIPLNRPVYGSDLVALRTLLGASAQDMQYLLSMNPNEWAAAVNDLGVNTAVKTRQVEALVRMYTEHPDLSPLQKYPSPKQMYDYLVGECGWQISHAELAILLGNQKTAGIRYLGLSEKMRGQGTQGDSSSKTGRWSLLIMTYLKQLPSRTERREAEAAFRNMMLAIGRNRGVEDVFAAGTWNSKVIKPGRSKVSETVRKDDQAASKAAVGARDRKPESKLPASNASNGDSLKLKTKSVSKPSAKKVTPASNKLPKQTTKRTAKRKR